jgi:hypothetical protein
MLGSSLPRNWFLKSITNSKFFDIDEAGFAVTDPDFIYDDYLEYPSQVVDITGTTIGFKIQFSQGNHNLIAGEAPRNRSGNLGHIRTMVK